jgi:hypothetical protein
MSDASISNNTTDLPVRRPIDRAPTHPGELFRAILGDQLGSVRVRGGASILTPVAARGVARRVRGAEKGKYVDF